MKHKLVKRILTAGLAAAVAVTAVPLTGLEGLFDSLKVRAAEEVREPMVISEDTTLKDVTIQGKEGQSAVKIKEGAHVTLTIEGTVRLTGGDAYYTSNHWGVLLQNGAGEPLTVGIDIHSSHGAGAGIEVPENSSLTIKGDGTLICRGGKASDGLNGVTVLNDEPKEVASEMADYDIYEDTGHHYANPIWYAPLYERGGTGGGGAGAGIGGKGGDNSLSTPSVGAITIDDDNLTVDAAGGAGGAGGAGSDGSNALGRDGNALESHSYLDFTTILALNIVTIQIKAQGGYGGSGGGGGGGGGGAATLQMFNPMNPVITGFGQRIFWGPEIDQDYAKGGVAGQNGQGNLRTTYDKTTVGTGGGGGAGGDTGGAAGIAGVGRNGNAASTAGAAGQPSGAKGSAGTITLAGGRYLVSSGGDKAAQAVGCGGGTGENRGQVVLQGGYLDGSTYNSMIAPTNGAQSIYPVKLAAYNYTPSDQQMPTQISVNDGAWEPAWMDMNTGTTTVWLPAGAEYDVSILDPVLSSYHVTVDENGNYKSEATEELNAYIDLAQSAVTFSKKEQGQCLNYQGNEQQINDDSIIFITGSGNNVICEPGVDVKVRVQNIDTNLLISRDYDRPASMTVEAIGTNNKFNAVELFDPESKLTFTGDEDSHVEVKTVVGANLSNETIDPADNENEIWDSDFTTGDPSTGIYDPRGYNDYWDCRRLYENVPVNTGRYVTELKVSINSKQQLDAIGALTGAGYTLMLGNADTVKVIEDENSPSEPYFNPFKQYVWAKSSGETDQIANLLHGRGGDSNYIYIGFKSDAYYNNNGSNTQAPSTALQDAILDIRVLEDISSGDESVAKLFPVIETTYGKYQKVDGIGYDKLDETQSGNLNYDTGKNRYLYVLTYEKASDAGRKALKPISGIRLFCVDSTMEESDSFQQAALEVQNAGLTDCYNEWVLPFDTWSVISSNSPIFPENEYTPELFSESWTLAEQAQKVANFTNGVSNRKYNWYMAVGRMIDESWPEDPGDENAGTVEMSSEGTVHIGNIYNEGILRGTPAGKNRQPADNAMDETSENFYGTPSIVINSGFLQIDTPLDIRGANGKKAGYYVSGRNTYGDSKNCPQFYYGVPGGPTENNAGWDNYSGYSWNSGSTWEIERMSEDDIWFKLKVESSDYNARCCGELKRVRGNNKVGTVTVNGGTLRLGEDGKGSYIPPEDYIDNPDTEPVLTYEAPKVFGGGNLLCNTKELPAAFTDGQGAVWTKMILDGLPENSHLMQIPAADGSGSIGTDAVFENLEIWTDGSGQYVTYVSADYNGKKMTLVDEETGKLYAYQIAVSGSGENMTAEAADIASTYAVLENLSGTESAEEGTLNDPVHVYGECAVVGNQVYRLTEKNLELSCSLAGGLVLESSDDLALNTEAVCEVGSITGEGVITLTGAGLSVTGACSPAEITVKAASLEAAGVITAGQIRLEQSAVTASELQGTVVIEEGVVYTGETVKGAVNAAGAAVYLAKIPRSLPEGEELLIDGEAWSGLSAGADPEKGLMIYVTADAKSAVIGDTYYYLELDDTDPENPQMKVTERLKGDGVIKFEPGDLLRIEGEIYFLNGQPYENENGETYVLSGDMSGGSVSVLSGSEKMEITLNSLTAENQAGNSPISLSKDVSAAIRLEGENKLTVTDRLSVIHVPEGASLTIEGDGMLQGSAGSGGVVIGGNANEVNGKITINGGVLDFTSGSMAAVGAGGGAKTPSKSIVVNGGSIRVVNASGAVNMTETSVFGTTPVNGKGDALSLVRLKPNETVSLDVKVDGGSVKKENWNVSSVSMDGKMYFYLPKDSYQITVGGDGGKTEEYNVVCLKLEQPENGTIRAFIQDEIGENELKDVLTDGGEMVVEGSLIRIETVADEGYGLKSGPASGVYRLEERGGELRLVPYDVERLRGQSDTGSWEIVTEDVTDESTGETVKSPVGMKNVLERSETMELGTVNSGDASLSVELSGENVIAELLLDGEVYESASLSGEAETYTWEWTNENDSIQSVSLRFRPAETAGEAGAEVFAGSVVLGNVLDPERVSAVFEKVYTLSLEQPGMSSGAYTRSVSVYEIADGEGGEARKALDTDPSRDGIQLFEGQKIRLVYMDTVGGISFISYSLTNPDGTSEEKTEPNLELTLDRNLKVSVNIEENVFGYTIIVPQDISCGEGVEKIETQVAADTINGLPQYTDEAGNEWKGRVDVSVSGLEPLTGGSEGSGEAGAAAEPSEYGLLLRRVGASETIPVQVRTMGADGKEQILTAAENTLVSFGTDVYKGMMIDSGSDPNAEGGNTAVQAPSGKLVFYPAQREGLKAGRYSGKLNFVIRYREEQVKQEGM